VGYEWDGMDCNIFHQVITFVYGHAPVKKGWIKMFEMCAVQFVNWINVGKKSVSCPILSA